MVVSAPDIDQEIIAPLKFVAMIRDIGRQIGIFAILFLDDTILFVAEA